MKNFKLIKKMKLILLLFALLIIEIQGKPFEDYENDAEIQKVDEINELPNALEVNKIKNGNR